MGTTVILVGDHALIREGVRRAFERAGDFEVVAEASSVVSGLATVAAYEAEVLVADLYLPDGSGLEVVRRARAGAASMGIVVLSVSADDADVFAALQAGASVFVTTQMTGDDLVAAARRAAASPRTFSAATLAEAIRRRSSTGSTPALSPRERDVLALMAEGLSVAEMAARLFVAESTAKSHVGRIYDKLGAANRSQALMTAVRLGLLDAGRTEPDLTRRANAAPAGVRTPPSG